jgi:hypothetical protein
VRPVRKLLDRDEKRPLLILHGRTSANRLDAGRLLGGRNSGRSDGRMGRGVDMTADQLRALFAAIDSLPAITVTVDYSLRVEVVTRGATISTNCWSGVIYSEEIP